MELTQENVGQNTSPHSEEAESNVLGIIMRESSFLGRCAKMNLQPESFYVPKHRTIYKAMLTIAERGSSADLLGVQMVLAEEGQNEHLYLESLIDKSSAPGNGMFYLKVVLDKAKLRHLIKACRETIDVVHHNHQPVESIISEAKFRIHQIETNAQKTETTVEVSERLSKTYEQARKTGRVGLSSRWFDVQRKIVTYAPGKMTLIGARPGQGKTTFGLNECVHKALIDGVPVLIISIEMTQEEIVERAIGDLMDLDLKKFKEGQVSHDELNRFKRGGQIIGKAPLYIEHGNFSIEQICSLVREYQERKGIKLCMIDYIQLIAPTHNKKFANRNLEVSWMSQNLVHAGNDTGVHLLVMSQLSRGMMAGPDKGEPELHHLRDSGSLEQDSYMTMFIFQDPNNKGEWEDNQPTIFKIAKHRGGSAPSRVQMTFQKSMQRFVARDFATLDLATIEAKQRQEVKREQTQPVAEDETPF